MAEVRDDTRHMERQRHFDDMDFLMPEAAESWMKKEAEEESVKDYEWEKLSEESEADHANRLGYMMKEDRRILEEKRRQKQVEYMHEKKHLDAALTRAQAATEEKKRKKTKATDAEAEAPVTDAGKPEEESVGSGKSAMDQKLIDEDILQQVLQLQLDRFGNSYIQDEAEEEGRRAALKKARENMAKTKEFLLHWQTKLPYKAQKESPTLTVGSSKLDISDLDKATTEPEADPNSVTIQDDHSETAKSALVKKTAALVKKTADEEMVHYNTFRNSWKNSCCKIDCDHFEQNTMLGSMQFTHYTPGLVPITIAETLQIFSMKLKLRDNNPGGFEFPLSVYGMVGVRDALDSRRNILFSCRGTRAQILTQDDPFLHITGPSRAILSADKVYFEISLKVKGSEDKPLITRARSYAGGINSTAVCFGNIFCTLEVCLQTVERAVQATVVGVQFISKRDLCPFNFPFGGQVACIPLPSTTTGSGGNQKIVLIQSKGREMLQGNCGYVPLSRQVVCVERRGGLDVVIQAYTKSGDVAAEGRVHFKAQNCLVSQQQCIVGPAQVTVTVAWSIVPDDMDRLVYDY